MKTILIKRLAAKLFILAGIPLVLFILALQSMVLSVALASAGKKVQEVHFDGSDVGGQARTPDGAYLVQKKGVDFLPLYKVRERFDKQIKQSVDYLR